MVPPVASAARALPGLELLVSTQPGGGPQHVYALAPALAGRGFAPIIGGPRDGALFDWLSRLVGDPERRDRLGPGNRERARRDFDEYRMIDAMERISRDAPGV